MTDDSGVTVSNGYADNNAPYDVATKTIDNKRFQKVILYDGSGNEVTSWRITSAVIAAVTIAYGKIAGASLTTSYQTLLAMGGNVKILQLWNSTEVPVIISLDGGVTNHTELGPYENDSVDYVANELFLTSGTIQAKLVSGSAPTNGGSVRAKVTR